ncbi:MAG: hypothetical protein R6V21_10685, partial [Pelovirga sp.]
MLIHGMRIWIVAPYAAHPVYRSGLGGNPHPAEVYILLLSGTTSMLANYSDIHCLNLSFVFLST